jgi:hypothetical protein
MAIVLGAGGDRQARCAHCGTVRDLLDVHGRVEETVTEEPGMRVHRRVVTFVSHAPLSSLAGRRGPPPARRGLGGRRCGAPRSAEKDCP